MSSNLDHVLPEGRWEFNGEVTRVFEEMLRRSIAGYDTMRWSTNEVAKEYLPGDWSPVYDLGASRGESVEKLIQDYPRHKYNLIECSEPMRNVLHERFDSNNDVKIYGTDLRYDQSVLQRDSRSSLVLSVLTLMFIPIEYRQTVVNAVYRALRPGGAFILVEKLIGGSADVAELFIRLYHEMKAAHGYSEEEIDRKRLSLEGVLVPLTETWNKQMLISAGFSHVECYFRCLQFAGFVAIK